MNPTMSAQQPSSEGRAARLVLTLIALLAAILLIGGTAATITTSTVNPGATFSASGPVLVSQVANGAPCQSQGATVVCGDLFKQRLVPGEVYTRVVTIRDAGKFPAGSLQLSSAGCSAGTPAVPFSGTGDLCVATWLAIHDDAHDVCYFPVRGPGACRLQAGGTLRDLVTRFGPASPIELSIDQLVTGIPFSIAIELDPSVGNEYQGRASNFSFTWRVNQP